MREGRHAILKSRWCIAEHAGYARVAHLLEVILRDKVAGFLDLIQHIKFSLRSFPRFLHVNLALYHIFRAAAERICHGYNTTQLL